MPIYRLGEEAMFPKGTLAEEDGLLAVGGRLTTDFILEAYTGGIFPWYNEDEPILWWCPNPRSVLFIDEIYISKSMKKLIKSKKYKVTLDRNFEEVIKYCKTTRKETWINQELMAAYIKLHNMGVAHSVEVWNGDKLVGGLYGISLGKVFYGESMFSRESNTSKLALIYLSKYLKGLDYKIIDCQVHNSHLESMGAREIGRSEFLEILKRDISKKGYYGNWKHLEKIDE